MTIRSPNTVAVLSLGHRSRPPVGDMPFQGPGWEDTPYGGSPDALATALVNGLLD